jgi:hypothetical protein
MDRIEDATSLISDAVSDIDDPLWQFELAALSASSGLDSTSSPNIITNAIAQIVAFKIAIATLGWLILRHGGTSPKRAGNDLLVSPTIVALHGEDTTRTRHLRSAVVNHRETHSNAPLPLVLLGRPSATVESTLAGLDPNSDLRDHPVMRPLSFGSYLRAFPAMIGHMFRSVGQAAKYRGRIPFKERIAIAYRMAQGAVYTQWWSEACGGAVVLSALFGHTGNADSSQLERRMQGHGIRTAHIVHGTNVGWSFAGLSDVAIFPSGADAKLGRSLPAYAKCTHLSLDRPDVSPGNGKWALLTSYTHLQHPSYRADGAVADIALVRLVAKAAEKLEQKPVDILWRPHPQINLVDPREKERLEKAVQDAGFLRWSDDLPYESLGEFSAAITTPSTVLTDALRLGQPAIVASMTPLQSDLLYSQHPLLVRNGKELNDALSRILDTIERGAAFEEAWQAIEPGARYEIEKLTAALHS